MLNPYQTTPAPVTRNRQHHRAGPLQDYTPAQQRCQPVSTPTHASVAVLALREATALRQPVSVLLVVHPRVIYRHALALDAATRSATGNWSHCRRSDGSLGI
jgi:hypothetical protein